MTENEIQELRVKIENFITILSNQPEQNSIEPTPDKKAFTLPIDFIETQLDELFFGQWMTTNFTYQQVFNEVVGSIELRVLNPVTNHWIVRVGAGAVVITQDSGAAVNEFATTKKKNALDLTFPKLKAECVKNAAQSLGNIFGRNLNRKKKDTFTPIVKNQIKAIELKQQLTLKGNEQKD